MRLGQAAAAAALVAIALVPFQRPAAADGAAPISGGGSGFASGEIADWKAAVGRKPYEVKVDYSQQGSSVGRQHFADGLFDFAASDITFQPKAEPNVMQDLKTKRCGGQDPSPACFVYVPVTSGGLSFMFNLLDNAGRPITQLNLTRHAVCDIFTGQVTRWNDPELTATAPQLADIDRPIQVVSRQDGAGESFVLSEFCLAVAPDSWQHFMDDMRSHPDDAPDPVFFDGQPISVWPTLLPRGHIRPAFRADGVANAVADPNDGKNAIGYDAYGYAKSRVPVVSVENAAGQFTLPLEENVTVALAYATGRGDGTFKLNFTGTDPRAYFPSTYSYVLAQTGGFDAAKGATLGVFLCYAVGKGQVNAPLLGYARLSSELVAIAVNAITKIPGAPPASQCGVGAPPAPPPPVLHPAAAKAAAPATTTAPRRASAGATGPAAAAATGPAAAAGPAGEAQAALSQLQADAPLDGLDAASARRGPSSQEVLSAMAQGAALCAIGLLVAGRRRRREER